MASKRFDNAISALVKAFFDGTLQKGDCSHCAVGEITKTSIWGNVFCTQIDGVQRWYPEMVSQNYGGSEKIARVCFENSGYNMKELAKVELAFERNTKIHASYYGTESKEQIMQDQYNGLMAVVEVLCEIEGIESAEYKKMFEYSV